MKKNKQSRIAFLEKKPIQFYKGIRIKADTGLHEEISEIIYCNINKNTKILDFGCGEGALSQRLKDAGYDVLSVDIDDKNFKANTIYEKIDFNNPKMVDDFYKKHEKKFDLVLGVEVIEHLENPWEYIRNLKKLLKKDGYILLTTPNITSWYSRIQFLIWGRFHQFEDIDRSYGHINPIAIDELEYICKKEKLQIIEISEGGWLPRVWLRKSIIQTCINLLGFIWSFFMKGRSRGWCIIALIKNEGKG